MQKTAYEMRISDWSSDVCSSDLGNTPSIPTATGWCRPLRRSCPKRRRARGMSLRTPICPSSHKEKKLSDAELENRKVVVSGKSLSLRVDLRCRRLIISTIFVCVTHSLCLANIATDLREQP